MGKDAEPIKVDKSELILAGSGLGDQVKVRKEAVQLAGG